jgi:hypothetical protein
LSLHLTIQFYPGYKTINNLFINKKRRPAMKALKNQKKSTTNKHNISDKKSSLKKTAIQNQLEERFAVSCKTGSFNLSSMDVHYQLFGDLIID